MSAMRVMSSGPNGVSAPKPMFTEAIYFQGITTRWETITQEIALKYLERNTHNRNLSEAQAKRYLQDMRNGEWILSHQGIAFGVEKTPGADDGPLVDGQTRLRAISLFDRPVPMLVTRGLPDASIMAIDRNRKRSLADTLKIYGYEHHDHRIVAIAKRVLSGPRDSCNTRLTDSILRKFIDNHIEAIVFSVEAVNREMGPASIRGAVARAFYHLSPEVLRQFGTILSTGEGTVPGAATVRRLREHLIGCRKHGNAGSRFGTVLYLKAQNAIRLFADGTDIKSLHEADKDLFPLPDSEYFDSLLTGNAEGNDDASNDDEDN